MSDSSSSYLCQWLGKSPALRDIRVEAESGCSYCSILYRAISDFSEVEVTMREEFSSESHVKFENGFVSVRRGNDELEHLQLFVPGPRGRKSRCQFIETRLI
jgi:hypothetical protein